MRFPANASTLSASCMVERGSLNLGVTSSSSVVGLSVAVAFIVATVLNHGLCQRCLNGEWEDSQTQNRSAGSAFLLIEIFLRPLSSPTLTVGL
jgi:hypothetical protein